MLRFDNALARSLPKDAETDHRARSSKAAYADATPAPVGTPSLLAYSLDLATQLGLSETDLRSSAFLQAFAGNQLLPGMQPIATNYGGHQFGHWAGQLGDGRAILLGEAIVGNQRFELQLKGAGPTAFSRFADGRAVLRSSLREFVCSEAMHALGVPTTRALCLISTGDQVLRDMFYDGNAATEPGAIICRVAPSLIRFGHFELPSARGDFGLLRQWLDFCIARDFPELAAQSNTDIERYAVWFKAVCARTAVMIAHWLRVGFVHGVMNTDNMSVLGLTIDYGPYGWLENFDPNWTPNTTDRAHHRYAFGKQASVAHWNLACLAQAIAPLFEDHQVLQDGLETYKSTFDQSYQSLHAQKLGLSSWQDRDLGLLQSFHTLMQQIEMDMTIAYRCLTDTPIDQLNVESFAPSFYDPAKAKRETVALEAWLQAYRQRCRGDRLADTERTQIMKQSNPIYVPRNWLLQQAIDAATNGDLSELQQLQRVLAAPYQWQVGAERFASKRPEWARVRAGCSMLSCSS